LIRHLQYDRARFTQVSTRLAAAVWSDPIPPDELVVSGPVGRVTPAEAEQLEYRPVEPGERFGPLWSTFWFRIRATVPRAWRGHRVDLIWVTRSEATLWIDGRSVQGLNSGGGGERPDAVVLRQARGGEKLELWIELACNGMFGEQDRPPELERCELALFDRDAWRRYHDFEVLRTLESADGIDPAWSGELRAGLSRYCDTFDDAILRALLEHRNATRAHSIFASGHAHIDTAWLWPIAETYRKTVRTFSSQTRYMEDYPEYRFACSQAQQYAWIRERNPDLWKRIRERVSSRQWVPVGGSWVEPDCNIPSGESLLRQFIYGQRFFEEEFGIRCREFWSPDAFGYCGQLPQLLRLAGMTRFMTQKLSWSRFNPPEHHTFTWQGDDGSEVLAHFLPADTYNSEATIPELVKAGRDFKDHDSSGASLYLFGYGDGGGGPTRTMLETLRRAADLQGVPRTRQTPPREFYETLEAEKAARPVAVGELYFEYHRGVYTTQAAVKRMNRRCEQLLHDAEFVTAARGEYPRDELDRLWKLLLLQQFHDILPGSSIGLVYEDAARDFAEIEAGATALIPAGDVPLNTAGVERREVSASPAGELQLLAARPYSAARVVEGDEVLVDGLTLENEHLRVELGTDGSIVSAVVGGREALAAPGNRLELYDDQPVNFDAWDIDPFHLTSRSDCPPAERYEVLSAGPLRAEVRFERELGDSSTLVQVVRLDAGSRRVEFHTTVDWHEEHKLLKVCFPLAVHARNATYEMPFGYAERPTHYTTRYDEARYEVPGHRFADLSEHGFGAALLTDSKYGYSCFGNELRISLLRSPKSPDPNADIGRHEFAYALYPHEGGWREAGVLAEAIRFNAPFRWVDAAPQEPFAFVDDPNLVLDTIKRAERLNGYVLRLYEAHGARGTARLQLSTEPKRAMLADALEAELGQLSIVDGAVVLPYRPHEVLTVLIP
jgi:alpha-mannosidase